MEIEDIFYQVYDFDKKNEIIIIEEFYEENDKAALEYKKALYEDECFLRKVSIVKKYDNIME